MLPDYYFDLGIPFSADLQAIKKAYRAKAIVAHPDRGGSHEAMLRINEAYEILANPDTRRHYDEARANQNNQGAQQQARADASQAHQKAEQYPRQWTDFESWLTKDFTEAQYGEWGMLPTASKSASGILFIVIGLVAGFIVAVALFEAGALSSGPVSGKVFILIVCLGGFFGQQIHKWIGNSMRRPGDPHSPTDDRDHPSQTAPADGKQGIVRCSKCNQQLRVPASPSGVQVRCPSCQFQFNVAPPISPTTPKNTNSEPANSPSTERAGHDKGMGFAFIVGIIAFVVLIFVCKSTVGDGLFVEQESFTNWPGVFIGTGICAFIAYYIGKKI